MDNPSRSLMLAAADGTALHARLWTVSEPRGVLVIAHGLGEHGGGYDHVAQRVRDDAGMNVLAFDFRGHGRSAGTRGYVSKYEDFLNDLNSAIEYVKHEWPGIKRFVLGHSNGGQVVLRAAARGLLDVDGLLLSNPALRLAQRVPGWKVGVGKVLDRVAPRVTLASEIDQSQLTRDRAMIAARQDDPLRHTRINSKLFFGLLEGGGLIGEAAHAITQPILFLLGGSDPIIDPQFTTQLFEKLGSIDKTIWRDPDMLHEPLNEIGRDVPIAVIVDWLKARL